MWVAVFPLLSFGVYLGFVMWNSAAFTCVFITCMHIAHTQPNARHNHKTQRQTHTWARQSDRAVLIQITFNWLNALMNICGRKKSRKKKWFRRPSLRVWCTALWIIVALHTHTRAINSTKTFFSPIVCCAYALLMFCCVFFQLVYFKKRLVYR